MSIKVIVADDSATIQKVVAITLANESVSLVPCENEVELLSLVSESAHEAVLLDFGLSEEISGYELIKKINLINPAIKIITMLPAFENVDEDKLSDTGSFATISKPFESNKFLATFRSMLLSVHNSSASEASSLIDTSDEFSDSTIGELDNEADESKDSFDPDEWVSRTPSVLDESSNESESVSDLSRESKDLLDNDLLEEASYDQSSKLDQVLGSNELSSIVNDWGISVPEKISGLSAEEELEDYTGFSFGSRPPIIESSSLEELSTESSRADFLQSSSSDLEEYSDEDSLENLEAGSIEDISWDESHSVTDNLDDSLGSLEGEDAQSHEFAEVKNSQSKSEELQQGLQQEDEESSDDAQEIILPSDDDLEYPADDDLLLESSSESELGIDLYSENEEDEIQLDALDRVSPDLRKPKFVDYDSLSFENDEDTDERVGLLDASEKDRARERAQREELEKEIASDLDPDDLWEAESISDPDQTDSMDIKSIGQIDTTKFFNDMKLEILERVDRVVRELCEEKIEKVAWEVIPEIAESLIKKEIAQLRENEETR